MTSSAAASDDLLDRVGDLVREVSAEVIEPRFRSLAEGEVIEKSKGELAKTSARPGNLRREVARRRQNASRQAPGDARNRVASLVESARLVEVQ